jgi:septum formation protein
VPDAPVLILASTSVYRHALLARLRIPFTARHPQVEEARLPGEEPLRRAERLALAKARAVSALEPAAVVIGADQVACCGAEIFDKPGDEATARVQLRAQSGRTVQFFTAVAVLHAEREFGDCFLDLTRVVVRTLSVAEIDAYLAADRPFDCAASMRSEGLGVSLCERIETLDPTALIGLPLIRLSASLRSCGYALP